MKGELFRRIHSEVGLNPFLPLFFGMRTLYHLLKNMFPYDSCNFLTFLRPWCLVLLSFHSSNLVPQLGVSAASPVVPPVSDPFGLKGWKNHCGVKLPKATFQSFIELSHWQETQSFQKPGVFPCFFFFRNSFLLGVVLSV